MSEAEDDVLRAETFDPPEAEQAEEENPFATHELEVLAGHTHCPLDTDGDGNCAAHPKGCQATPCLLRMAEPGTRNFCVTLAFSQDGIALFGDATFGPFDYLASCSKPGRGIGWLRGARGEYLAEKFLRKTWNAERAAETILDALGDDESADPEGDIRDSLVPDLESGDASQAMMQDALLSHGWEDTGEIGMCYDPRAVFVLDALARRFDELMAKRLGEVTP